jgi:hypothetical protein
VAEIYLLRFGGQLAGQHTVAATPGGRGGRTAHARAASAGPRRHTPTHHSCCGIGSGPTGEEPHVSRFILCYRTIFF